MKIALYSQRVEELTVLGERRDCADQRIAAFIRACGYLPIPVPNNPETAMALVKAISPSGIVLVGGNSLVKYGGDAPERDETDKALIRIAIEKRIPLYGFCRGMQSIIDFFGNDLIDVLGHVAVRHKIYGWEDTVEVNSFHKQACIELKNNELVALMKAEDGVIEKIQHREYPIVGTMWHPEREQPFYKMDIQTVQVLFGGK